MKALFHIGLSAALVAAAALVFFPAVTYAQKDAGAKARGEHSVPFWSSRSSARRISAAHDYARDFQRYVAANPKPNPAVVKEVTTEIGKNLDEAKAHLAQLKKDFAGNKEAIAGIEGCSGPSPASLAPYGPSGSSDSTIRDAISGVSRLVGIR